MTSKGDGLSDKLNAASTYEGDGLSDKSKAASTNPEFDALKQQAHQAREDRLGKWGKGDGGDPRTVAGRQENRDKLAALAKSLLEEGRNTRVAASSEVPSNQVDTATGASGRNSSKKSSFPARVMQLEEKTDSSPAANRAFRGQFGMDALDGSNPNNEGGN